MADNIVSQDPTKPGVLKANGTPLAANGKLPLTGIDPTGAVNGNVIVLAGGVWTAGSSGASSDTASNLGGGAGVFSSKVAADFQFKSLVAGSNITITPAATTITIASTATGPFSSSFVSTDQIITAAGLLTLAHGLGSKPTLIRATLICQVGENGYTAGDETEAEVDMQTTINQGLSVVPDAANIVIRYGSAAITFQQINKTTGNSSNITNANWKLRIYAWK